MVHSQTLTAEALLGAPRRSPAVPNADGTLVLYSVSTHDFREGKTLKEVKVMDIKTGFSRRITYDDKVHDVVWMPDGGGGGRDEIVALRSLESGHTQIIIANGAADVAADADAAAKEAYVAAEIAAPVSALKMRALREGGVAFVVAGLVGGDGSLFNPEVNKPRSTGRIFDTGNVRIWTELRKEQRYSLWYNKLELQHDGKWALAGQLINLVPSPRLETPTDMYAGDPLNGFDVGNQGVVFLAKSSSQRRPEQALFTDPYYVRLHSFVHPPTENPVLIERLGAAAAAGMGTNIRISPDDGTVAFLYAGEEDLQDVRLYTASVQFLTCAVDIMSLIGADSDGDDTRQKAEADRFPPDGFEFAGCDDALIVRSAKHGRDALSYVKLRNGETPHVFFHQSSVNAFYPLRQQQQEQESGKPWTELLITSSSFVDSSLWQIVTAPDTEESFSLSYNARGNGGGNGGGVTVRDVFSATRHGAGFGISREMVTEFWYEGKDGYFVHSWMVRPSNFDEGRKYPWVLMPHGGPISAWQDSWSTRWNAAAWAEQGYIIICPNVSGSTGFGLEFTKRVEGQWGGNPYQDLVYLLDYLKQLPYLDREKAVLAGASYGGYLVSWFLGHEIIKQFCCAIWHDGIFNLPSFSIQSDLIYNNHEYGPSPYPWLSPHEMHLWNPARPDLLSQWKHAPPTLIIASEKDYRCPITEGLAAFNTLQAHGVPSRFLTFADEGHWVLKPENALIWHRTVWEWVRRCVDGDIKRGDQRW